ncbi:MAG: histone deacetylase family protein [Halobacteriota archaeon]
MTGIVYHKDYLEHEQDVSHPEGKERLLYTIDLFKQRGVFEKPEFKLLDPLKATEEDLEDVHQSRYIQFLKQKSKTGGMIDLDTKIPVGLFDIALLAAGGAIKAAKSILEGEVDNAFAMVRPPGHHAKPYIGAGFCYLNNIAIAVKWLQRNGIGKVLIIDWDAHHGDGTQEIFYEDDSVLFISLHQVPLFPGTGYPEEVGKGKGQGYTVNVPLPPGSSDDSYMLVLEEVIEPIAREFDPDFIAVSVGMDNHFTDPLTDLAITARGYAEMMSRAVELSQELCQGRIFGVLEGGYSVKKGLPHTMLGVVSVMRGMDPSSVTEPEDYMGELAEEKDEGAIKAVSQNIENAKKFHSKYWKCFQ